MPRRRRDGETERRRDGERERERDGETEGQRDKETERQRDAFSLRLSVPPSLCPSVSPLWRWPWASPTPALKRQANRPTFTWSRARRLSPQTSRSRHASIWTRPTRPQKDAPSKSKLEAIFKPRSTRRNRAIRSRLK